MLRWIQYCWQTLLYYLYWCASLLQPPRPAVNRYLRFRWLRGLWPWLAHDGFQGLALGFHAALEADVQPRESEERVLCFGRTKSGRLLTILYTERRGKIRVVTAYEMTKPQQQMYFEGK